MSHAIVQATWVLFKMRCVSFQWSTIVATRCTNSALPSFFRFMTMRGTTLISPLINPGILKAMQLLITDCNVVWHAGGIRLGCKIYALPGIRDGRLSRWQHASDSAERDKSRGGGEMDHLSSEYNCSSFPQQLGKILLCGEFAQDPVVLMGQQNTAPCVIGSARANTAFRCSWVPV